MRSFKCSSLNAKRDKLQLLAATSAQRAKRLLVERDDRPHIFDELSKTQALDVSTGFIACGEPVIASFHRDTRHQESSTVELAMLRA